MNACVGGLRSTETVEHYKCFKHISALSAPLPCPLRHATIAGKVQLSEEEARQEGEEGRALNVTGEDNQCSASCPAPVTIETKLLRRRGCYVISFSPSSVKESMIYPLSLSPVIHLTILPVRKNNLDTQDRAWSYFQWVCKACFQETEWLM